MDTPNRDLRAEARRARISLTDLALFMGISRQRLTWRIDNPRTDWSAQIIAAILNMTRLRAAEATLIAGVADVRARLEAN